MRCPCTQNSHYQNSQEVLNFKILITLQEQFRESLRPLEKRELQPRREFRQGANRWFVRRPQSLLARSQCHLQRGAWKTKVTLTLEENKIIDNLS